MRTTYRRTLGYRAYPLTALVVRVLAMYVHAVVKLLTFGTHVLVGLRILNIVYLSTRTI